MNIDQLIRDADPAAGITIPDHDSPLARESFERVLATQPGHRPARRGSFAVPALIGAVAVAAAAIVVITSITPGVPVSSAAAAVLDEAAAAAARQKPLVLGPGEYLYTETRSLAGADVVVGNNGSGGVYYPEYVEINQSWLTSQGLGKSVSTVVSPVTFADGTRKVWIKAGRPKIYDHNPAVNWYTVPKPESDSGEDLPGDVGFPLENVSHLPTDPAALAQAIQQRKTGLSDVNGDVDEPSSPAGTFYAAMLIVSEDPVGATPALRSALFKVMAEQPGIKLLGRTKTRSGRTGIGLQTSPEDSMGDVSKVIIDPASGQILEYDDYQHGVAEQWTEYLSTAVVKKIGQLPHR
jgi:hypothetical protein